MADEKNSGMPVIVATTRTATHGVPRRVLDNTRENGTPPSRAMLNSCRVAEVNATLEARIPTQTITATYALVKPDGSALLITSWIGLLLDASLEIFGAEIRRTNKKSSPTTNITPRAPSTARGAFFEASTVSSPSVPPFSYRKCTNSEIRIPPPRNGASHEPKVCAVPFVDIRTAGEWWAPKMRTSTVIPTTAVSSRITEYSVNFPRMRMPRALKTVATASAESATSTLWPVVKVVLNSCEIRNGTMRYEAVARVMAAKMYIHPTHQPTRRPASSAGHWYMTPAKGQCDASSAQIRQTNNVPRTTNGQPQKNAAPAEASDRPNSAKMPALPPTPE